MVVTNCSASRAWTLEGALLIIFQACPGLVPTIRKLVVAVGSGVITFDSLPDFETKSIYEITVEVSDGTNSVSQDLTIDVTKQ